MVVIPCPLCEGNVELEDDDFGLFACPHCDDEFNWEKEDLNALIKVRKLWPRLLLGAITFLVLLFGAIWFVVYQYAVGMTSFQG
jgi:hypothetical protein|tara:strand:+ start:1451 stop:1702 length:252 start_codon:yes stop_codon:yes gene_type:complete